MDERSGFLLEVPYTVDAARPAGPERLAHQARPVLVRQISRCVSTDPGAVQVLGKWFRGDWEINGELGWQTGSFERCIGEEQAFTLTLPNAPGSDGRLHRDRLAIIARGRARPLPGGAVQYAGGSYRPGDEFLEFYTGQPGGEPVYVGTPTKALVSRSSIELSGWCGFWRLKKTREFQAGFWADSPRDVIEHYTGIWDCLYADDMRDVHPARVAQNATFADGVATLAPPATGEPDAAYVVGGGSTGYSFSAADPVRAEAVVNVAAVDPGDPPGYARFLITYHTSLDNLGTAHIEIHPVTGEVVCKSDVGTGLVSRTGMKVTLGTDVALAIEIRYGWSYFYVDGTLVAVLPWPETNAVYNFARPKVVRVAGSMGGAFQMMKVRSIVWRVVREFLLRGPERGDLRLPGVPPPGGLLGYYFDGADEVAKFPPIVGDPNSLGYRLMRAPTKQPAATRRDAQLDFASAGAAAWQPAGVPGENFAVRWCGAIFLDFATLRDVRLRATADDQARVFVGKTVGGPLITATVRAGVPGVATSVVLSSHLGTSESGWYPFVLEYLQEVGPTKLLLEYEAATNPGVWVTVPATMLSPYGCYIGHVRNDSHYDTLKAIADSFGYQLTCKPYSLESGRFPGQLVPRVREGIDVDKVVHEDEATDLSDAIDAEAVCDALMADAAGVADPNGTAQLTAEMLNFDEATEHLGLLTEYEALAEISERELLEQRLVSLLTLSSAPWEEVSARPPGFRELLDRWPLPPTSEPGEPILFDWNPGDAPRLELPSLGVIDRGPRQIMRVARQMSREGLKPPVASFRQRPRSYRDLFRQLRRTALQPQRNYQGTLVERVGTLGSSWGADPYSRIPLPAKLADIAKAELVVCVKGDASPWAIEINGTARFEITRTGPYDITPWVAPSDGPRMFARLVALGGSTGVWEAQLVLTVRR